MCDNIETLEKRWVNARTRKDARKETWNRTDEINIPRPNPNCTPNHKHNLNPNHKHNLNPNAKYQTNTKAGRAEAEGPRIRADGSTADQAYRVE